MLEIKQRFSILFIDLLFYLLRFNNNKKCHFLKYMLTRVSNFTFPSLNNSMFTKEDGITINNKDIKEGKK